MTTIILASNNKDKVKEVKEILKEYNIISLKDAGIDLDVEENGTTFEENALIKARAVCKLTGQLTMADDSGLEIDYLNKEPGVYSARYMGHDTSYDIKNASLIKRLEGVEGQEDWQDHRDDVGHAHCRVERRNHEVQRAGDHDGDNGAHDHACDRARACAGFCVDERGGNDECAGRGHAHRGAEGI